MSLFIGRGFRGVWPRQVQDRPPRFLFCSWSVLFWLWTKLLSVMERFYFFMERFPFAHAGEAKPRYWAGQTPMLGRSPTSAEEKRSPCDFGRTSMLGNVPCLLPHACHRMIGPCYRCHQTDTPRSAATAQRTSSVEWVRPAAMSRSPL